MLYFNRVRPLISGLMICLVFAAGSSNSYAKRPVYNSSTSCLSGKDFNQLAKNYLVELLLINPSLTMTDVKTVLKSAGSCATLEEYGYVIEQYRIELTQQSLSDSGTMNTAPQIGGAPLNSITEGEFYIFTPSASDTDNDSLEFSVQNLPSWAYFDSRTGTILGVPMAHDIGLHADITITVSDSINSNSLAGFSVEVLERPSSSQSPLLGEIAGYSIYMGTATDNLSDVFQLDVGSSGSIQFTNSLSAADTYYLHIVAYDSNNNKITLPISEIRGFRFYIGTTVDNMNPIYNFAEGAEKIYWVNGLMAGTYYVSVTTFDVNGNETPLSNIAQFDIL